MFTFFCFQPEIPFLDKFGPKKQNCQFKLKFDTHTYFRYAELNPGLPFFRYPVDQKYAFWASLVQKIRTVSLTLIWVGGNPLLVFP